MWGQLSSFTQQLIDKAEDLVQEAGLDGQTLVSGSRVCKQDPPEASDRTLNNHPQANAREQVTSLAAAASSSVRSQLQQPQGGGGGGRELTFGADGVPVFMEDEGANGVGGQEQEEVEEEQEDPATASRENQRLKGRLRAVEAVSWAARWSREA